MTLLVGSCDQ